MAIRISIGPGQWREGNKLYAQVRVGSSRDGSQVTRVHAWPLGTDRKDLTAWQLETRAALLKVRPTITTRGSLAADVPRFLATLPTGRYAYDSAQILAHWIACPLGARARGAITRLDLVGQIAAWTDAGVAASTCNRRLSRLRKLFHAIDGIDVPNPTDKITFLREPERDARDIPARIVRLILDSLPKIGPRDGKRDSATKLRLSVMAWTGMAPATIARVQARDLDLSHARIYLRGRRKGKGAAGAWLALVPPAVDAWRAFVAAGLLGRGWSNASAGKTWRVGIKRATAAADGLAARGDRSWRDEIAHLPPKCRPYDLRHSFGSELYRATGDLRAVAELLQHADLETTKRYTKGAVSERVTAAIAAAADTYANVPTLPAAPVTRTRRAALRIVR